MTGPLTGPAHNISTTPVISTLKSVVLAEDSGDVHWSSIQQMSPHVHYEEIPDYRHVGARSRVDKRLDLKSVKRSTTIPRPVAI
jgi:hypothetical protein